MVKYEFEVEHYDGSMVVEDMRDPEVIAADDARVYGIFFTHEPHRQPAKLFKFTKSDWEEAELDRVAEAEVQVTNPARRNRDVLLGAFFLKQAKRILLVYTHVMTLYDVNMKFKKQVFVRDSNAFGMERLTCIRRPLDGGGPTEHRFWIGCKGRKLMRLAQSSGVSVHPG